MNHSDLALELWNRSPLSYNLGFYRVVLWLQIGCVLGGFALFIFTW
jgi:hypothetical protein